MNKGMDLNSSKQTIIRKKRDREPVTRECNANTDNKKRKNQNYPYNIFSFGNMHRYLCIYITYYLDIQSISRLTQINKHWNLKLNSHEVWERFINNKQMYSQNKIFINAKEYVQIGTLLEKKINYPLYINKF
eukprot:TRINITY_DN6320_c0_g1_i5.p1 TRINITY_DN6320_c0_g1~~TRINITY_DN6320_c0_g1_i5.p1  ORF type:complete len:132 (-),score=5.27 TRINITY_DN6320_c0_g1_i5:276-671(-)